MHFFFLILIFKYTIILSIINFFNTNVTNTKLFKIY